MKETYSKTDLKNYMQAQDLAPSSIKAYTRLIEHFLQRTNKDILQITKADILQYLNYLKTRRHQQNITRRNHLIALNHFFSFLVKTEYLPSNPTAFIKIRGTHKKSLYNIFTPEALKQLQDDFYHKYIRLFDGKHIPKNQRKQSELSRQRNAAILSILLNQGVTTKEVDNLQICDMDLIKASLFIRGSKKSNERKLLLEAEQIGLLMHYIQNIRPQILALNNNDSEKLFLPLPEYSKTSTDNQSIMSAFKPLSKQVKTLNTAFFNFKQIRASIITNWIKTNGLRKAQYLAGHRYISTTERYLANDIESLTDDINTLHPF
jgi:site-specific recombinase XerD